GLGDQSRPALARLAAGTAPEVQQVMAEVPLREYVSASATYPLMVHRERALYGSWYELFPRSEGAYRDEQTGQWVSGTLRTAAERLPGIAAMGFDVVYLTPVHPIGTTNRKGRNNTLTAEPGDPGSPYGIGSAEGGHEAIHPDLGTFADFDHFVASARELGMEVALDIGLQACPDHPWVTQTQARITTLAAVLIAYSATQTNTYHYL